MKFSTGQRLTGFIGALAVAALVSTGSLAQSVDIDMSSLFKGTKGVDFYPKPWPLKNLVKPGTLTVGMTGTSPPKDFIDPKTGELTGVSIDLYKELASDLGLKVEFVKLDFAGILPGLAANRFDMGVGGCSYTKDRLASSDFFITSPHTVSANIGLTLKSTGIKSWADTKGKRMGAITGEIESTDAKNKLKDGLAQVIEYPGNPEAMLAMANGQVDFIVSGVTSIKNALATSPIKDRLSAITPPLTAFPQGLCVNPRQGDLLKAANLLLGNYRADGKLKALFAKYGADTTVVDTLKEIGY